MSAGAIPVLVVRDYVKPFTEQVDWSAFSFTFSPEQAPDMLRTLRAVPPETVEKMQVIKEVVGRWKLLLVEKNVDVSLTFFSSPSMSKALRSTDCG